MYICIYVWVAQCDEVVSEGCCAESITRSFIFVFDNSYSKLRSKTCVYNIRVVAAEAETEVKTERTGAGEVFGAGVVAPDIKGKEGEGEEDEETGGETLGGEVDDAMQSGESDDDSMCDYASAEGSDVQAAAGGGRLSDGGGGGGVPSSTGGAGGGAIAVEGRGFSVDLVPLAASSRAVAAPEVPEQVSEYLK